MDTAPASRWRRVAAWCVLVSCIICGATGSASASHVTAANVAPAVVTGKASGTLTTAVAQLDEPIMRTAAWPPWLRGRSLFGGHSAPIQTVPDPPHPAVARIIVPEDGVTAYGSGTLVDVRDQFGLVVTNWHVVRDSQGTVEVVFPNGFRSHARPLKVDSDWDLAALVIWRPAIEPVRVSQMPPRPGDVLTIHGYGQGMYRIATGRCTAFYAPKRNFPLEMVELDVQARQGDSGGPIFNQNGELAGVLFGAGDGTTIGSFAPRVESFLATLAPDIGESSSTAIADVGERPAPNVHPANNVQPTNNHDDNFQKLASWPSSPWATPTLASNSQRAAASAESQTGHEAAGSEVAWQDVDGRWLERMKTGLAVVGLIAIGLQLVRMVK